MTTEPTIQELTKRVEQLEQHVAELSERITRQHEMGRLFRGTWSFPRALSADDVSEYYRELPTPK